MSESDWLAPASHYSKIDGNLWMGGWPGYDAQAGHHRFDYIFDLYGKPAQGPRHGQLVVTWAIRDHDGLPDLLMLEALAEQVRGLRQLGPTLVHCEAGWNRSGLLVALALIRDGWFPSTAIQTIRDKRHPMALSNKTFAAWLATLTPGCGIEGGVRH